jgi:hypothetical protein
LVLWVRNRSIRQRTNQGGFSKCKLFERIEQYLKTLDWRRAEDAASIVLMPDTCSGTGGLNLPVSKLQRLKESMTGIASALTGADYSLSIQKI